MYTNVEHTPYALCWLSLFTNTLRIFACNLHTNTHTHTRTHVHKRQEKGYEWKQATNRTTPTETTHKRWWILLADANLSLSLSRFLCKTADRDFMHNLKRDIEAVFDVPNTGSRHVEIQRSAQCVRKWCDTIQTWPYNTYSTRYEQ